MCLKKLCPRPLPFDAPSIIPGISATVYEEKLSRLTTILDLKKIVRI